MKPYLKSIDSPATQVFDSAETLIAAIRAGEMVVLLDDEHRENEGDLVMAAHAVKPEHINFMVQHARGLVCLTLTEEKAKALDLPLMVKHNQSAFETNFACSIEAASGVTTGISAYDRAHTIQTAVRPNATAQDIVRPGHIFPIIAKTGGVLTRAGHTEASVDLARLAGFNPEGVIVEIMNDDGTMARRDDLLAFAKKHGLKIGTIADLIQYRLGAEQHIQVKDSGKMDTAFGSFEYTVFEDKLLNQQHIALVNGEISKQPVNVRVHMAQLSDALGVITPHRWSLNAALSWIAQQGGVVVLLQTQQDSCEWTYSLSPKEEPLHPVRMIGVGSQILAHIGVKKMRLLGSPRRYAGLSGFGLEIVDFIVLEETAPCNN
jgi:3,4-dihydroxy 2-butanone 4-phosphate synthase/GTP cyclohydrolase II